MLFRSPIAAPYIVTQTFNEHVARHLPNYNGGQDMAPTGGVVPPVYAAQVGNVEKVAFDAGGYGWFVKINHGEGWHTLYAHLSEVAVLIGQHVKAGERIGTVGSTGNSTGPHLHFEVRKANRPVDPAPLMIGAAPEPAAPVLLEPAAPVTIAPGWNLRLGPGTANKTIGEREAPMQAEVSSLDGDWVQVRLTAWVHKDALK